MRRNLSEQANLIEKLIQEYKMREGFYLEGPNMVFRNAAVQYLLVSMGTNSDKAHELITFANPTAYLSEETLKEFINHSIVDAFRAIQQNEKSQLV